MRHKVFQAASDYHKVDVCGNIFISDDGVAAEVYEDESNDDS